MFRYFKGKPTTHIIQFRNGKVVREGRGIQFWYAPRVSTVAVVPVGNADVQFIFTEATANYQEVAIQGSLMYRIIDPVGIANVIDFTVKPGGHGYQERAKEVLEQRIINTIQDTTRSRVNAMTLEEALTTVQDITENVLDDVRKDQELVDIGVEVTGLHFTSVQATPEMKKALEAQYREHLQRDADQAIYARRAAAVEEERNIKERELNTEVELEVRRKDLVDTQARNTLALAEADAKAEKLRLNPYVDMPPQTLVGLALKEWAGNAGAIDNLSITPDLLTGLVGWIGRGQIDVPKSAD